MLAGFWAKGRQYGWCCRLVRRNKTALFAMAAVAALAVVAICMSPAGNILAARFDATFVYISKVRCSAKLSFTGPMCSLSVQ